MTARATRAVLALLVCGALTSAVTTPAEAATRCAGKRPTLVSKAKVVTGTFVDDVIVVLGRGAVRVDAGGGDDTICVRTGKGADVLVSPGMGDDVIRVEKRTTTTAMLDGGRDVYLGGPGRDLVTTGVLGQANRDRVILGGGDDRVTFAGGTDHRRAVVKGSSGRDSVAIDADAPLVVDASRGLATVKGRVFARWSGFEDFGLTSSRGQTFLGSDRHESVSFDGAGAVRATTRGGDDRVTLDHDSTWTQAPVIDTGEGRDVLRVEVTAARTVGSLVTDRVEVSNALGHTTGFGFVGVEDLTVVARAVPVTPTAGVVELYGDDADNVLQGSGCDIRIHGGAGNDHLRVGLDPESPDRQPTSASSCAHVSQVHGEAGNDVLVSHGTSYTTRGSTELVISDLLDGGDGIDTADAGAGQDTCIAETRVACEA